MRKTINFYYEENNNFYYEENNNFSIIKYNYIFFDNKLNNTTSITYILLIIINFNPNNFCFNPLDSKYLLSYIIGIDFTLFEISIIINNI